jgi:hypothetical protein
LVALVDAYLTDRDELIVAMAPYWRDLLRYEAMMLRVEALPAVVARSVPDRPRQSGSMQILNLDWDIPALLGQFRAGVSLPVGRAGRISLLLARSRHGRVTTVRCTAELRLLLEQMDGTRGLEELAERCRMAREVISTLVRQLQEVGALS